MNSQEIAFAVKRTKRLVEEYLLIIQQYGQQSEVLSKLLDFHPKVK